MHKAMPSMLRQVLVTSWRPNQSRSTRRGRFLRRGFSLPELLVVLVIAAVLMRISMPRFASLRDKTALKGAKQQLVAYLMGARTAAIRQSQTGTFNFDSGDIWTTV